MMLEITNADRLLAAELGLVLTQDAEPDTWAGKALMGVTP